MDDSPEVKPNRLDPPPSGLLQYRTSTSPRSCLDIVVIAKQSLCFSCSDTNEAVSASFLCIGGANGFCQVTAGTSGPSLPLWCHGPSDTVGTTRATPPPGRSSAAWFD
ncbi:unnamed protein product [Pleuronectes platessa]|uniref:Uncharacterized protein n=1 Tax=Pleuronectes platessa TaxID=8262 RepID=A0A9N7Y8F2_PLEPL|nr:unnamed protein product [Pleuronectes platessa]